MAGQTTRDCRSSSAPTGCARRHGELSSLRCDVRVRFMHPAAAMKSLNDLFIQNLRRVYDSEKRLVKALPKMRDAATSGELKHAFQSHLEETEAQVDRLDQVFEWFGEKPKAQTCEAIKGMLGDGKD